jgi:N-acetylated-alpha-linked acidic dipeptidase
VQRGSVQYLFKYPGDPETPGVASTLDLPDSARIPNPSGPGGSQPHIISIPLSYHDAAPILQALKGPVCRKAGRARCPSAITSVPAGKKSTSSRSRTTSAASSGT